MQLASIFLGRLPNGDYRNDEAFEPGCQGCHQGCDAAKTGGLRLLDQRFMVIRQAMGVPKAKGADAADYVARLVAEMRATNFVEDSLMRHGINGAVVAKGDD